MRKIYFVIFLIVIIVLVKTSVTVHSESSSGVTKHPPLSGDRTQTDIPFTTGSNHVYNVTGSLNISGNNSGNETGVVFVSGNLNFTTNYTYGTPLTGTVFVVNGNINIDPAVTRIDAVLISSGTIYTAGAGCSLAINPGTNSQLVINGSLISLSEDNKIEFCRKLGETGTKKDSTDPAELINHQVKYLVILRDLISETYQKWSEIP